MHRLVLDFFAAACNAAWNNPEVNISGRLWLDMREFFASYALEVSK